MSRSREFFPLQPPDRLFPRPPGESPFEQVQDGVVALRHTIRGPLGIAPPVAPIFEEALQPEIPTGGTKLYAVIIPVGATTGDMLGAVVVACEQHRVGRLMEERAENRFRGVEQIGADPNLMDVLLVAIAPDGGRELPQLAAATPRIQDDHHGRRQLRDECSQQLPRLFQALGCSRSTVSDT